MPDIISNTSCLIVLDNSNMLFILKDIYGEIYITEEVKEEFGKELPEWIKVKTVSNKKLLKVLNNMLDIGEASTIALSLEMGNSLIILDDLKARKIAKNLDLKFTGTLGVVLKAKENNIIPSMKNAIKKLKNAGFRISDKIEKKMIQLSLEK